MQLFMQTLTDLKDGAQILYMGKNRKIQNAVNNNFTSYFFKCLKKLNMTVDEAFSKKRNVKMCEKHILRYLLCNFSSAYHAEIQICRYFYNYDLTGYKRCNLLNSQTIVKEAIANPLTDPKLAKMISFYKIKS